MKNISTKNSRFKAIRTQLDYDRYWQTSRSKREYADLIYRREKRAQTTEDNAMGLRQEQTCTIGATAIAGGLAATHIKTRAGPGRQPDDARYGSSKNARATRGIESGAVCAMGVRPRCFRIPAVLAAFLRAIRSVNDCREIAHGDDPRITPNVPTPSRPPPFGA